MTAGLSWTFGQRLQSCCLNLRSVFETPCDEACCSVYGLCLCPDPSNHVVRKLSANGTVVRVAGQPGVAGADDDVVTPPSMLANQTSGSSPSPSNATLDTPVNLYTDAGGSTLYISCGGNGTRPAIRAVVRDSANSSRVRTLLGGKLQVAGYRDGTGSTAQVSLGCKLVAALGVVSVDLMCVGFA